MTDITFCDLVWYSFYIQKSLTNTDLLIWGLFVARLTAALVGAIHVDTDSVQTHPFSFTFIHIFKQNQIVCT